LRARRQLSFPQHRWWRRLRASGTKSFLQLTHLRRPNGFIASHLQPYRRPQQTDLSRSEERFRREVNPPTRSKYFYLESGRISTDHWSLCFRQKKIHFTPPLTRWWISEEICLILAQLDCH
jgi:hypothetical protein